MWVWLVNQLWVDWGAAAEAGMATVPLGVGKAKRPARGAVRRFAADLMKASEVSVPLIAQTAQLPATDVPARVVDRPGWVRINTESLAGLLPETIPPAEITLSQKVTARVAGAQVGLVLAALGSRVLGQFDPFSPSPRLLLVAPNIWQAGHEIGMPVPDFMTWVALHEHTHRAQFAAAGWLADHLRQRASQLLDAEAAGTWRVDMAATGVKRFLTPEQALVMDEITAVMSVLEGHADVMMDEAGPTVIDDLPKMRRRFNARRRRGGIQAIIGKLLGMEAKLAQYRDGAKFTRAVIEQVGVEGFNHVFTGIHAMPELAELHDPKLWWDRVMN